MTTIKANINSAADISIPTIGVHRSPLSQKFGVPRQPNLVKLPTYIEMYPPYDTTDAFIGIEEFSHLWITWQFHHNKPQACFKPQIRPPRLGGNQKIGVFASRSMYRPSSLGLSVVTLDKIEVLKDKVRLHILGADMIDGTPIIDIKPYLSYSDCLTDVKCGFAHDKPTQKMVQLSSQAECELLRLIESNDLKSTDINFIKQLIAQDPRPAYRQKENESEFVMRYGVVDVTFMQVDTKYLIINHIQLFDK